MTISNELWFTGSGEFSVAFAAAAESSFATPTPTGTDGDWVWLDVLWPTLTWEVNTLERQSSAGTRGAASATRSGKRKGTFTVRAEMPGQLAAYDGTGTPGWVQLWGLIKTALGGGTASTYGAGTVTTGGTTSQIVLTTGALVPGTAVAFGPSANAIRGIGWVKSVATVTATMAYAMGAAPVSGDNIYPLASLYPSTSSVLAESRTWRVTGEVDEHDVRLAGCVLSKINGTFVDADRLFIDFEVSIFGGYAISDDGGVRAVDSAATKTLGAFYGVDGAHLMLDGTAPACGVTAVTWGIEFTMHPVECTGAPERVGGVVYRSPITTVGFTVDHTPDFVEEGEWLFDRRKRLRLPVAFALSTGKAAGTLFALHMPAGLVQSVTQVTGTDGQLAHQVVLVAGSYSGDGASTNGGNRPARAAIG